MWKLLCCHSSNFHKALLFFGIFLYWGRGESKVSLVSITVSLSPSHLFSLAPTPSHFIISVFWLHLCYCDKDIQTKATPERKSLFGVQLAGYSWSLKGNQGKHWSHHAHESRERMKPCLSQLTFLFSYSPGPSLGKGAAYIQGGSFHPTEKAKVD